MEINQFKLFFHSSHATAKFAEVKVKLQKCQNFHQKNISFGHVKSFIPQKTKDIKAFGLFFIKKNTCSEVYVVHTFFISSTFISNARLKLIKNQANAKQHLEAELLLFENYSHSSSTLSSKNNRAYSKKQANEQVCLYS